MSRTIAATLAICAFLMTAPVSHADPFSCETRAFAPYHTYSVYFPPDSEYGDVVVETHTHQVPLKLYTSEELAILEHNGLVLVPPSVDCDRAEPRTVPVGQPLPSPTGGAPIPLPSGGTEGAR